MKKIFKALVMALIILPCSILFVACGSSKDKEVEPAYDKTTNIANFNTATEKLKSVGEAIDESGNKYTVIIDADSYLSVCPEEDNKSHEIIKFDGNKILDMNGHSETYYIDGVSYSRWMNSETNEWSAFIIKETEPAEKLVGLIDMMAKVPYEGLVDYCFTLNDEAINTVTTSDGKVVTLTLDLDVLVNRVLSNLKTNRNQPIATFINQLFVDFGAQDVSVESIAAMLKENVDEEILRITIGDIVENIAPEGADIGNLFNTILNTPINMGEFENETVMEYDTLEFAQSEQMSIADLLGSVGMEDIDWGTVSKISLANIVSQILQTEIKTKDEFVASVDSLVSTMKSENCTLENVIDVILGKISSLIPLDEAEELDGSNQSGSAMPELSAELIYQYLNFISIEKMHANISIALNSNNAFESVEFVLDFSMNSMTARANAKFGFEQIGTTTVSLPESVNAGEVVISDLEGYIDGDNVKVDLSNHVLAEYLKAFNFDDSEEDEVHVSLVINEDEESGETEITLTISGITELLATEEYDMIRFKTQAEGTTYEISMLVVEAE